jgi:ribonuclease HI
MDETPILNIQCRTTNDHNGNEKYNTNEQTDDHCHGLSEFVVSSIWASGNRWTRNPKTRNIRRLTDDSRNIKLIWVPSHIGIGGNEAADQAAKEDLNEEIGNQEPYPPRPDEK